VLRVEKRFRTAAGGKSSGKQGSHALHIPSEGLMWFQGPSRLRFALTGGAHSGMVVINHLEQARLCTLRITS